ncbi:hypothetical protein Ahu01nite_038040 [Winogradskya humida]|uniref:Alpha/beta hydrolase n=2 Tax=Winogradskya humida TaxID=113566 RepID=A0ABQ3ZQ40_9ACTN|nr:hypothetical protein Ahu01nite_038040 [Actinoplanes humidus]
MTPMIAGIVVPGGTGHLTTLPDLGWEALRDREAHIETVTWSPPRGILDVDPEPFVRVHIELALRRLPAGAQPVVIAKSFGTYAAALAAERSLPAIWLTPLLTRQTVVDGITRNTAPQLLVCGTADEWWDAGAARATGKRVLTVENGEHSLRVPGPLRNYTEVLGVVGTAIEEFLDALD